MVVPADQVVAVAALVVVPADQVVAVVALVVVPADQVVADVVVLAVVVVAQGAEAQPNDRAGQD